MVLLSCAYLNLVFVQWNQVVLLITLQCSISSNTTLDTMAAVAPKIITVMKSHETSLSVQLEALRAVLHFIVPGELHNR